jgi:DNA (cytosine-5)-methyltransferase 1
MRYGSVCSGIEAASVAWHPLGWSAAWLAEIEAFPSAVLAHHYPDVPNFGDMTQLPGLIRLGAIEAPDVLVGGTPCQAFSVAGLRNSLDDHRGQLTLSFVDLANAIDEMRIGNESIIVWENVPGVLNTHDNAFGCFLGALAGEDIPLVATGGKWTNAGHIVGPQRTIAWRVLDAQYFGVAQRRRRVFVVASARAGFDPAAVLLEWESVRRDTPPSRKTREEVAYDVASCIRASGVGTERIGDTRGQDTVVPTLTGNGDRDEHGLVTTLATGQAGAEILSNMAPTLNCNHEQPIVATSMQVRRLTPTECERLQGFPDGYSLVPCRNKPAADGPRYKALGNSMAVPVMHWIGSRINDTI